MASWWENVNSWLTGALTPSVSTTPTASDLQVGAVEIKNATDDTRAIVDSSGRLSVHDLGIETIPM